MESRIGAALEWHRRGLPIPSWNGPPSRQLELPWVAEWENNPRFMNIIPLAVHWREAGFPSEYIFRGIGYEMRSYGALHMAELLLLDWGTGHLERAITRRRAELFRFPAG